MTLSILHNNRRIAAPRMLDLVFLDWHELINNEDTRFKFCV